MRAPFFSIVIPVYNASKYLDDCLLSIKKQSFTSWECICVDDGSIDSSLDILKKYENADERFIVHCQGNGGVSSARNAGIERSRGIYVAFVDSDDYVDENYLRKLANVLISDPELDLVACGHLKVWEDGRKKEISLYAYPQKNKEMSAFCSEYLHGYPFCKIFKNEIIKKRHIYFNSRLVMLEDHDFCMRYYRFCKRVKILDERLYYYRQSPHSAVNKFESAGCDLHVYCDACELYVDSMMNLPESWAIGDKLQYCGAMEHLFFHRFSWVVAIWRRNNNCCARRVICRKIISRIPDFIRLMGVWRFVRNFPIRHLKQVIRGMVMAI